jgi:hypothetical protein
MLWDPAQKSGARVAKERKDGKTVKVFKTVRKSQEGKK